MDTADVVATGAVGSQLDVVRYNTDGSLDAAFGNGGTVTAMLSGAVFEGSRVTIDRRTDQFGIEVRSHVRSLVDRVLGLYLVPN